MSRVRWIVVLIVVLSMFAVGNDVLAKGIYGDKEPVHCLYPYASQSGLTRAMFSKYTHGPGVFVHVIGDRLGDQHAHEFFGQSLDALDELTYEQKVTYYSGTLHGNQVLLISAIDVSVLEDALRSDKELQKLVTQTLEAPQNDRVTGYDIQSVGDSVWMSSGYQPQVFRGLFVNPPYEDLELLLGKDAQTARTEQIELLADLINDRKDMSTLEEIYNLIRALTENERPPGFPIHVGTASKILTQGVVTGCTAYATSFATLARAKGIPCVVVNSAKLDWIQAGCQLSYVQGHLFVEVFVENEWYLIDSTAGILYLDYDRSNWYLPSRYVAFAKGLSVIDTGVTEESHNLLQRVAFLGKGVDYEAPNYIEVNLQDDSLMKSLQRKANRLRLQPDTTGVGRLGQGDRVIIEASSEPIDFSRISMSGIQSPSSLILPGIDEIGARLEELEKQAELMLEEIRALRRSVLEGN